MPTIFLKAFAEQVLEDLKNKAEMHKQRGEEELYEATVNTMQKVYKSTKEIMHALGEDWEPRIKIPVRENHESNNKAGNENTPTF